MRSTIVLLAGAAAAAAVLGPGVSAQRRGGPPGAAREQAPVDVTGYWVSVVTEDWRWRMVTPQKGDYTSVPLNAEGRRAADGWDLAGEEASGNQCRAYGVGGLMRQPGRLHVTWADEATLKVEFDAGTQTRVLNFDKTKQPGAEKTWQGFSIAEWEGPVVSRGSGPGDARDDVRRLARTGDGRDDVRLLTREELAKRGTGTGFGDVPGGGGSGLRGGPQPRRGLLDSAVIKVDTRQFRPGYLRKNGVPYSESAAITEYFQWLPPHPNGDHWLVVTTTVDDPKYLQQPFYTSTNFKREPDGAKWNPSPCHTDPPAPLAVKDVKK